MTGPHPEDRVWYLTLYNENYPMPALPPDEGEAARVREGTIRGMYRFDVAGRARAERPSGSATILFSGTAWRAAVEAQRLLASDWDVDADTWSVTSYKSLREDALSAERWNRLHVGADERVPFVTESLKDGEGPIVAVTDFMRAVPDQVARWMPRPFTSLGTDGFGRSDTREVLRRYFEVDPAHLVVAVLHGLVAQGRVPITSVGSAIERYGIDPTAADPWSA